MLKYTSFLIVSAAAFVAAKVRGDLKLLTATAPDLQKLGYPSYVKIHPNRMIVMHSLEECELDAGAKSYVRSLRKHVTDALKIEAVGKVVEVQLEAMGDVSAMSVEDKLTARRDTTMDVFSVLAAMYKSDDDGKAVAKAVNSAAAKTVQSLRGKRRLTSQELGVPPLETQHMSELLADVVSDPDGVLSATNLVEIAKKLPCMRITPEHDVLYPVEKVFSVVPTDPHAESQWHLTQMEMYEAWETFSGSDVTEVVAVVDTGCTFHPDLAANLWMDPNHECSKGNHTATNPSFEPGCYGWDFGNNDGNPLNEPLQHLHGTAVSGCIAALPNNGYGVAGMCWGCKIACLKVSDGSNMAVSSVLRAYNYILERPYIRISNHSYAGYGGFENALNEAIGAMQRAGHLMVCSAGNDDCNLDGSDCPGKVMFPGGYPHDNILTVGSTDGSDSISYFSNYGVSSVDIFAPGEYILTTQNTLSEIGNVDNVSGTSFSSPLTAGLAAMVWSAFPNFTYKDVIQHIKETSKRSETLKGYGVVAGVVNGYNALMMVDGNATHPEFAVPAEDLTEKFYGIDAASSNLYAASTAGIAVMTILVAWTSAV